MIVSFITYGEYCLPEYMQPILIVLYSLRTLLSFENLILWEDIFRVTRDRLLNFIIYIMYQQETVFIFIKHAIV